MSKKGPTTAKIITLAEDYTILKWMNQINSWYLFPSDSALRQALNKEIIKLKEDGTLSDLYKKWWQPEFKENGDKYECDNKKGGDETKPMGLKNVGGVFIVLIIGILISLFCGFIEFLWAVRQTSIVYKVIRLLCLKTFILPNWDVHKNQNKSISYR